MTSDRQRLRARLRNAERRLAQAERAEVNTASAQYSGYAGTDQGRDTSLAELNERIAGASGVDQLRAEVMRLRAALGDEARPTVWQRLLSVFSRD